jgi:hypothetical protein
MPVKETLGTNRWLRWQPFRRVAAGRVIQLERSALRAEGHGCLWRIPGLRTASGIWRVRAKFVRGQLSNDAHGTIDSRLECLEADAG